MSLDSPSRPPDRTLSSRPRPRSRFCRQIHGDLLGRNPDDLTVAPYGDRVSSQAVLSQRFANRELGLGDDAIDIGKAIRRLSCRLGHETPRVFCDPNGISTVGPPSQTGSNLVLFLCEVKDL